MHILNNLFTELKEEFNGSRKGKERSIWFIYTMWQSFFQSHRQKLQTYFVA